MFGNRRCSESYITKKTPNYTAVGCVTILTKLKRIYKETDVHFTGVELVSLHRLSLTVKKPLTVSRDVDVINAGQYIVESLSATLWAFLLTVTKVSRYVPYDLLVK